MAEQIIPRGYARDLFDLEGRVAVVTGAASGLGQAISPGSRRPARSWRCSTSTRRASPTTQDFIDSEGGTRDLSGLRRDVERGRQRGGGAVLAAHGRVARPGELRRLGLPLRRGGLPRGSLRRAHRAEPQGQLPAVPGVRTRDARTAERLHHQHRVDRRLHRLPARDRVPAVQGRRHAAHPRARAGVARPQRPGQRHRADPDGHGPDRADGQDDVHHQRLHRQPHAARPPRQAGGAHRRRDLPRQRRVLARHRA